MLETSDKPVPHRQEERNKSSRRARNRISQQQSRKRRQAADQHQRERLELLEHVLEEICSVVVDVVDRVMETEAVVEAHPSLVDTLRTSMTTILNLANKAADVPVEEKLQDDFEEQKSSSSVSKESCSPSTSQDQSGNFGNLNRSSDEDVLMTDDGQRSRYALQEASFETNHSVQSLNDSSNVSSTLDSQNFANGWSMARFPMSRINTPLPTPTSVSELPPTVLDAFTLRLLRTTLLRGYLIISGKAGVPSTEIQRVFGHAFSLRNRESITEGMQFVLGPGHSHIFRASGATWKSTTSMVKRSGLSPDGSGFLSTVDIQDELMSKGARMLDEETMEIGGEATLSTSRELSSLESSPVSALSPTLDISKPRSYVDFAATRQPQVQERSPSKLWVSVPMLISILAQLAVCVSRGPVFPVQHLWAAVAASVTMRQA